MKLRVVDDDDDDDGPPRDPEAKQLTPEELQRRKEQKQSEKKERDAAKKENRTKMIERSKAQRQQQAEKESKSKEKLDAHQKERDQKSRKISVFDPDYDPEFDFAQGSAEHQPKASAEKKAKVKPNIKKPNNNKSFPTYFGTFTDEADVIDGLELLSSTDVFNIISDPYNNAKDLTSPLVTAEQVLEHMEQLGIEHNASTYEILFRYYTRIQAPVEVKRQLFDKMVKDDKLEPVPDIIPVLLRALGDDAQTMLALQDYFGLHPVLHTTVNFNMFIANAIKLKESRQVKFHYTRMAEVGVSANIDTYYLMVSHYGALGKFETAKTIIRNLPATLGPLETLHASVIKSYIDHNRPLSACRYVIKMLDTVPEIAKFEPISVLAYSLLSAGMDKELGILVNKLAASEGALNVSTYNAVLTHIGAMRSKEAFIDLYCHMIEWIRPNFQTFKALIQVAIKSNDVNGCKIIEQQILGELRDFKVGLFRDIVAFYHAAGDIESLKDTIDYIFRVGHIVPNGINNIFVHFELEGNQSLVDYLLSRLLECPPSFQSIHITKTIQLLLVTGNYQKALRWLELREHYFGLPLDSFAILPFYYFHKLRGEFDLVHYWAAKAHDLRIDLKVPQQFETYFRSNLRRDGTFITWAEYHMDSQPFDHSYQLLNHPENAYLLHPKLTLFNRSENILPKNINLSRIYEPTRPYSRLTSYKVRDEEVGDDLMDLARPEVINPVEEDKKVGHAHVDLASRVAMLLNQSKIEQAMTEVVEREESGMFVGEFVYHSLITHLLKIGDEVNIRRFFIMLLEKEYSLPMTLVHKIFKLTHEKGNLEEFISSIPIKIRPSYLEEKYCSFLIAADVNRGLAEIQQRGKEDLLDSTEYKNAMALGYLNQNILDTASGVIIIHHYVSLKNWATYRTVLKSMKKHLQKNVVAPPPSLDLIIQEININCKQ
eukprot:gene9818-11468_t